MREDEGPIDIADEVLLALSAVVESLQLCSGHIADALLRAEGVAADRRAGLSYAETLEKRDGPQVLESLTAILSEISDKGSRLRRAEARALYAEGLSMEKIARLFGVSRQRVSTLLQPAAGSSTLDTVAQDVERGGLALTDPEFRMIADVLPHIVWIAAPDGAVEYFNTQGADYIGEPRDVVYDWRWVGIVHPDDGERAVSGWRKSVRSGTPFDLEYRIRRADGAWRWHAFRALPFRGPDGQVAKWLGTAIDIESEKRLERKLLECRQQMAERTERSGQTDG